ncbi:MAG TPA: amidohydrolase family protein [Steroidobacteraceae bacterium]|jgi:imidazolonepropionase-like amidohydrolase
MSTQTLFRNARVFNGSDAECPEGVDVLVEDGLIREVSDVPLQAAAATVIDAKGRTLMPGMIDAHVHAYACDVNVQRLEALGATYRAAHATRMLGHALDSGFTTVRDVGGGDYSLAQTLADGLIRGPRYFYSGRILSMTGGHGDFRPAHEADAVCGCRATNSLCRIADGVDEMIQAAREELRRGAHCIKITASGGVASPTDPIWMNQFREDEIRAVVEETTQRRTYTAAHCHSASAIRRCVEFGVHSIEHGTLIDLETAQYVASMGAFIVPTMAIIFALQQHGKQLGFPPASQAKVEIVHQQALAGMDYMRQAGAKIGFGTDLLGKLYVEQCKEFLLRREVFTPLEILRQATSISAELMMQAGQIGCVKPGAHADLLVVEGDPLKDIALLAANGRNLPVIMRGGEIVKNELS